MADEEINGDYIPNTEHVEEAQKKVEEPPPHLMVEFKCPMCGFSKVLDAYLGVPHCSGNAPELGIEPHIPFHMRGFRIV